MPYIINFRIIIHFPSSLLWTRNHPLHRTLSMVIAIKNIGPNIPHLSVTITLLITFHNICNSHLNFNARLSVRENNISIIRPGFLWKDTYKSNAWHLVKNLRTICLFYSLFSDIFFRWKYFDTWRFNALYITFTRIHTHTHTLDGVILLYCNSLRFRVFVDYAALGDPPPPPQITSFFFFFFTLQNWILIYWLSLPSSDLPTVFLLATS